MPIIVSAIAGYLPMLLYAGLLYWLDRYEKEPLRLLLGSFLWGSVIAALGAFLINSFTGYGIYLITRSENISHFSVISLIAPLIEELLKGIAVLLVLVLFFSEYDSILDGIIYAGITALGFAASENAYYLYRFGYLEGGWQGLREIFLLRTIHMGWTHPFYSSFLGVGLAGARLSKGYAKKIVLPLLGWSVAIFTHATHNLIVLLLPLQIGIVLRMMWDWLGWVGVFGVIIWSTSRERRRLRTFLAEEKEQGLITPRQYTIASSAWHQLGTKLVSIFRGQYRQTSRFYQVCGELSHKKRQLETFGNESGNRAEIAALRRELGELSPQV